MDRKSIAVIMTLTVTVTLIGSSSISANGENDPSPRHSFDCGLDKPPSGPYLDLGLLKIFDYDCNLQTLTPDEDVISSCIRVDDIAIAGGCAMVREGPNGSHEVQIRIAVVGEWHTVEYWSHTHGENFPPSRDGIQGEFSPLTNGLVTYGSVTDQWNCSPAIGSDWWYAHARAIGSGSWSFAHHGKALGNVCEE